MLDESFKWIRITCKDRRRDMLVRFEWKIALKKQ